jgi:hypothetical protein
MPKKKKPAIIELGQFEDKPVFDGPPESFCPSDEVVIPSQAVMKRIRFLLEGIAIMGSFKHDFPVAQDEIVNIMRQWEAEEKAKS